MLELFGFWQEIVLEKHGFCGKRISWLGEKEMKGEWDLFKNTLSVFLQPWRVEWVSWKDWSLPGNWVLRIVLCVWRKDSMSTVGCSMESPYWVMFLEKLLPWSVTWTYGKSQMYERECSMKNSGYLDVISIYNEGAFICFVVKNLHKEKEWAVCGEWAHIHWEVDPSWEQQGGCGVSSHSLPLDVYLHQVWMEWLVLRYSSCQKVIQGFRPNRWCLSSSHGCHLSRSQGNHHWEKQD